MVLGTLLGMASCGLDVEGMKETNPDGGTPLELTVSASDGTIVLNERKSEETALGLSWTTGSNYGTGNAIEYILDIDLADGTAVYEKLRKRPVLGAFSRLHYNPSRWWTWFSDIFAVT